MNKILLENPDFLSHNDHNRKNINQLLEIARNLRQNNKRLDDDFISLNEAIVTNTNDEIKFKNKTVIQKIEICDLKKNVSIENNNLFDLKEQLMLRKLSEFFLLLFS